MGGLRLIIAGAAVLLLCAAAPAFAGERYRPTLVYNGPTLEGRSHSHGHLPDVSGAAARERRAATAFVDRAQRVAEARFGDVSDVRPLGFRRGGGMRFIGQDLQRVRSPFVHYKSAAYERDGHVLDPRRPEALVYWKRPRGGLVLVGLMFRAPSLERPPDRGLGPYLIWHAHAICDERREPGNPLQFRSDKCASGLAHHGTTQMTHVWFTASLRHAYALEVPARQLGIFIEGAPGVYADKPSEAHGGDHEHGSGHRHGEVDLTATQLVVSNAWTVSVGAPLLAGFALLTRRRPRRDPRSVRFLAIGCLGGVAVTHAVDLGGHAEHAGYLTVLFCALIAAAGGLAMILALGRYPRPALVAAGALSAAAIAGFMVSRTIGLPGLDDHVGEWGEPAAVLALTFESVLVGLAVRAGCSRAFASGRARAWSGASPAP